MRGSWVRVRACGVRGQQHSRARRRPAKTAARRRAARPWRGRGTQGTQARAGAGRGLHLCIGPAPGHSQRPGGPGGRSRPDASLSKQLWRLALHQAGGGVEGSGLRNRGLPGLPGGPTGMGHGLALSAVKRGRPTRWRPPGWARRRPRRPPSSAGGGRPEHRPSRGRRGVARWAQTLAERAAARGGAREQGSVEWSIESSKHTHSAPFHLGRKHSPLCNAGR